MTRDGCSRCAKCAPLEPPTAAPRIDWHDPGDVASWLEDMRAQTADVIAAGLDATAPPGGRDLGRRAARRKIVEAERKIGDLFTLAALEPDGGAK